MSKNYEDWADWAGDHPEQAEEQLRKERERAEESFARVIRAGLLQPNCGGNCEHDEVDNQGVCENCDIEVEGWEPDEAQLLHQFGTKEPAA